MASMCIIYYLIQIWVLHIDTRQHACIIRNVCIQPTAVKRRMGGSEWTVMHQVATIMFHSCSFGWWNPYGFGWSLVFPIQVVRDPKRLISQNRKYITSYLRRNCWWFTNMKLPLLMQNELLENTLKWLAQGLRTGFHDPWSKSIPFGMIVRQHQGSIPTVTKFTLKELDKHLLLHKGWSTYWCLTTTIPKLGACCLDMCR